MKPWNRLRYLTIDPQNAATSEALAAKYHLDLEVVGPRDLPRLQQERADLVLDWDCLPPGDRARLLNGTTVNIVAIHGYNLGELLASFLPRRGILCTPRLDDHLFQALAAAADSGAA